ncbi:MAG: hypothetical protein WAU88_15820 [Candidatus Zixiibacteriota bacterium]
MKTSTRTILIGSSAVAFIGLVCLFLAAKKAGEIRGPFAAGRSAEGYIRNSRFVVGKYGSWDGYNEESEWLVTVVDLDSHGRHERTLLNLDSKNTKLGRLSFADERTATIEILTEPSDTVIRTLELPRVVTNPFGLDTVYCPVTHSFTQGKTLNAFLRLKDDGSPDCLELRQLDNQSAQKCILFRAFGATTVTMKLEMAGVRFSLFSDTSLIEPDSTFVLDLLKANPYFEFQIKGERQVEKES